MLDTPEFARGRQGEIDVAAWLQARGWYVVPSYDYSGAEGNKPPRLQGRIAGYAIPDLDVSKDGQRIWVEVKSKREPTLHRMTGTLEHGISLRLWRHYQQVQSITGSQVWLFVLEELKRALFAQSLACLGEPRIYEGQKMGRGGMAFWPCDRFRFLADLERSAAA